MSNADLEDLAGVEPARPDVRVPLAALHAERSRRQAAERERDTLLSRLSDDEVEADPVRDDGSDAGEVEDQPEQEHEAWLQSEPAIGLETVNAQLNAAEDVARRAFGDDAVDAAEAWAEAAMQADPAFAAEVLRQPNPYAFIMGYAFASGAPGPAVRPRGATSFEAGAQAPLSLVAAPSAGGAAHVPIGPGQAYDSAFGR